MPNEQLSVLKTYKLYIDGKFPRTESGRYYVPSASGRPLGNVCLASRKDFRNAMVAARGAQEGWSARSAYNRGQILYRIAEMLEGRRAQFIDELLLQGQTKLEAETEVQSAIDRLIVYAGWADKYQQLFSCVNPVASSHFNFSILEPIGVVVAICAEQSPLLALVSMVAPVIAGGNTCVVLASNTRPLSAITFAEVLHCSDVPGGIVNLLTGDLDELHEPIARHMDVDAIVFNRSNESVAHTMAALSSDSLTRFMVTNQDWLAADAANPYWIQKFCETKTTWHPIEKIGAAGSGY